MLKAINQMRVRTQWLQYCTVYCLLNYKLHPLFFKSQIFCSTTIHYLDDHQCVIAALTTQYF